SMTLTGIGAGAGYYVRGARTVRVPERRTVAPPVVRSRPDAGCDGTAVPSIVHTVADAGAGAPSTTARVASPIARCPPDTVDVPAGTLTLRPYPHRVRPRWPRPLDPEQAYTAQVPRFCIQSRPVSVRA